MEFKTMGWKWIADAIKENTALQEIYLANNMIREMDFRGGQRTCCLREINFVGQ
jgi:hypothetical protein